jgi:DNA polymerase (family 10)
MANNTDQSYTDEKRRKRWRGNDEIADQIKRMGDYLIICGYDESHAKQYGRVAYTISRFPESVIQLYQEGRLNKIPGVGPTIAGIIGEFIKTGTCAKMEQWVHQVPKTVLELTAIPGLGAKTIRVLSRKYKIRSLRDLKKALNEDKLQDIKGIGQKTLDTMRRYVSEHESSD